LSIDSTLVGFDFPIGVPATYADRAGVTSFVTLLPLLGSGRWSQFFDVARVKAEISLHRPFYPNASGGTKRDHVVRALGLRSAEELYRECEVADGPRACPTFWTLGGNQVGKAAITGWRDVVQPALATGSVAIWPFDGAFEDLIACDGAVIVETYPGDVYQYVGAGLPRTPHGKGKRVQASRKASAPEILAVAASAGVDLSPELVSEVRNGFGANKDGEDRFDAVMGVLGMLAVVQGRRPTGVPAGARITTLEGWILGRTARKLPA
jgi:hypothetical protein